MKTYMKMPFAGLRNYSSAGSDNQGAYGYYWSASAYGFNGAFLSYLGSSTLDLQAWNQRSYGTSIRPFKNTPVQPDDSWTVLYPTS